MNEYLTTVLAEEHRQDLLAEARAEALAREALAGRPSWWRRVFARSDHDTHPHIEETSMTTMPFHSDPTGLGDQGPDNLHAAEAAATVHGDSVNAYGIEMGEATDDDIEARIISADLLVRVSAH